MTGTITVKQVDDCCISGYFGKRKPEFPHYDTSVYIEMRDIGYGILTVEQRQKWIKIAPTISKGDKFKFYGRILKISPTLVTIESLK